MCFNHEEFDSHEEIVFVNDVASGLKAIIAIHDTRLGPALGGTRYWPYANTEEARRDVLRLSKGMTYKNALAGLKFGGGKAVILAQSTQQKSPALLRAYAEALNRLEGRFITGEDVGVSVADVDQIRMHTPFIAGTSTTKAASGDPSRLTAEGVFLSLAATAKAAFGAAGLQGVRVGVQGLGAVGGKLAEKLHNARATLIVSDIDPAKTAKAAEVLGATIVDPDAILTQDMDIFAPCGLGRILDEKSVAALRARAVAGAANNQLACPDVDRLLFQRGVLYAPDYVINAGGVINVAAEAEGAYDAKKVMDQVRRIPERLKTIFNRSKAMARPTGVIADEMALEVLENVDQAA